MRRLIDAFIHQLLHQHECAAKALVLLTETASCLLYECSYIHVNSLRHIYCPFERGLNTKKHLLFMKISLNDEQQFYFLTWSQTTALWGEVMFLAGDTRCNVVLRNILSSKEKRTGTH